MVKKQTKIECYYHLCDKKNVKLYRCKFCGDHYCIEHKKPQPPIASHLNPKNNRERLLASEAKKKGVHPCPEYAIYWDALKEKEKEEYYNAQNNLLGHSKGKVASTNEYLLNAGTNNNHYNKSQLHNPIKKKIVSPSKKEKLSSNKGKKKKEEDISNLIPEKINEIKETIMGSYPTRRKKMKNKPNILRKYKYTIIWAFIYSFALYFMGHFLRNLDYSLGYLFLTGFGITLIATVAMVFIHDYEFSLDRKFIFFVIINTFFIWLTWVGLDKLGIYIVYNLRLLITGLVLSFIGRFIKRFRRGMEQN